MSPGSSHRCETVALEVLRAARGQDVAPLEAGRPLDAAGLDLVSMFLLVEELDRRYGPTPPQLISTWTIWDDIVYYIERRELDADDLTDR